MIKLLIFFTDGTRVCNPASPLSTIAPVRIDTDGKVCDVQKTRSTSTSLTPPP